MALTHVAEPERESSAGVPSLCVAICTAGRRAGVRRALASVAATIPAPAEVVVVDNAPASSAIRALIAAEFPSVLYAAESVRGLDAARNRALAAARSSIVAFLDDDAVADPGWVAAIASSFRDPRVGSCTSRVGALGPDTDTQRLFEANGGFDRGSTAIRLPDDAQRLHLHGRRAPLIAWAVSVGSGCGLAVRRELALGLGGFDEALDQGPALPGGGDHDMIWRIVSAGHVHVYEPAARLFHEHRADMDSLVEQLTGHQRALIAFLGKTASASRGRARVEALAFLAWRLVKPGVRLIRRARGRDPMPAGVLFRMWLACWRGLGAYPVARDRARRNRAAALAAR